MHDLHASARVLVTGGTGFVGRSLLRWLGTRPAADRPRLTLLSRDPESFCRRFPELATGVEWLRGDVGSFTAPEGTFTHVLHGATETTMEAAARPDELVRGIVEGTRRVLEVTERCGASRLLYLSSGAVYGPQPEEMAEIPEDYSGAPSPTDASAAYGRAKRVAETLCLDWATRSGRTAVLARLFAFVGEDLPLDAHYAIGNFIGDALARRPIMVRGDGTPVRSYLSASCLAEWLWTMLERAPSGAFNVGSDEAIDMAHLARLVVDVVSPGLEVTVARARPDYVGRRRYVPSIAKAKAALGLRVRLPLAEAIRVVADWHRAKPGR